MENCDILTFYTRLTDNRIVHSSSNPKDMSSTTENYNFAVQDEG